jgi:hypothetical protein
MPLQGLEGVGGAGGVEPAGLGLKGGEVTAVRLDQEYEEPAHAAYCISPLFFRARATSWKSST